MQNKELFKEIIKTKVVFEFVNGRETFVEFNTEQAAENFMDELYNADGSLKETISLYIESGYRTIINMRHVFRIKSEEVHED